MTNTINAAANPALANQLLTKALDEAPVEMTPEIVIPSDTVVDLPGGFITAAGEIVRTAEVRELNGRDEEAISKATNLGRALMTILQRGTVKIGTEGANHETRHTPPSSPPPSRPRRAIPFSYASSSLS